MDLQDPTPLVGRHEVSSTTGTVTRSSGIHLDPPLTLLPRYTFPIPIPASHTFFLSELDYKDGFVHLSTAKQVPMVLDRFFPDVPSVVLLRLETDRVGSFKRLSWDESEGQSESRISISSLLYLYFYRGLVPIRPIIRNGNIDFLPYTWLTSSFFRRISPPPCPPGR